MFVLNVGLAAVLARLPGRRTRDDDSRNDDSRCGGSYLHWVPDGHGGLRLAGYFLPDPELRGPGAARTSPGRRPRRAT
ncbi:hypothetical protein [Pseudonocardia sp. KRD291]|uniref:hypothetical protein n=1 Tax=Pseudonocardia sp. KRD291 TaxID=2792007 RepID=UPI001C49CCDE|nr:hypothetical protein [Pseudonocardia sp. KRD291]MBW0106517.1 hypothetical protein [Pseudonocardia sp. KRD291]